MSKKFKKFDTVFLFDAHSGVCDFDHKLVFSDHRFVYLLKCGNAIEIFIIQFNYLILLIYVYDFI